jgi:hypothetical protein
VENNQTIYTLNARDNVFLDVMTKDISDEIIFDEINRIFNECINILKVNDKMFDGEKTLEEFAVVEEDWQIYK